MDKKEALPARFRNLQSDIYGNRAFLEHLRNRGKFFDPSEQRERDLILIDYDNLANNEYEVTHEWAFHNGHYGTREDVVFLINGIPVLVIECKNATKEEGIALGVDQIRRYHSETPEHAAAFYCHRCARFFLRGDLEHRPATYFQLEAGCATDRSGGF